MLENGYVTLPRLFFRNWEWSDDANTVAVFVRLLIEADIVPNSWHGIPVPRGGMVSSYTRLAEKTGLSVKKVRTAINTLKRQGVWQRLHTQIVPYLRLKTSICFRQGQACGQTRGKPWTSQRQATGNRIRR